MVRIKYGVKIVNGEVIRDHFDDIADAKEFVQEWSEDGGTDVEIVARKEFVEITPWYRLAL